MLNWLQITVGGLKMVTGVVVVADSMSSGLPLSCVVNSLLTLAPLAWAIASQFVPDNFVPVE